MDSKKIVIVDDDTAILDSLGTMLDFEGFEVDTFECGSDIFNYFEQTGHPSIILLDMWLAGEDGRDICKKIRQDEKTKHIPILMMSASRGLAHTAIDSGACDFIAKPFEIEDMINKLHSLSI